MIYQAIEKAGNQGIWTRDIKTSTNVNQVMGVVVPVDDAGDHLACSKLTVCTIPLAGPINTVTERLETCCLSSSGLVGVIEKRLTLH